MNPRFGLISLFAIYTFSGCSQLELTSRPLDRDIVIDGRHEDWQDALTYLKDHNLSIGILNDESDIYLCLATSEMGLESRFVMQGLLLWFDGRGGTDKTLGIRYPMGMRLKERQPTPGDRPDSESPQNTPYQMSLREMEIIGPEEGERHHFTIAEIEGIQAKARSSQGMFVYEVKVPLQQTEATQFAIGAEGKTIGMGLETAEPDRERFNRRPQDVNGGNVPPGRPGIGEPGRGGFGGGRRPPAFEQMKVWAKVQLAQ